MYKWAYNTPGYKLKFHDMINNSWINSDEISWLVTTRAKRNDKIDSILT